MITHQNAPPAPEPPFAHADPIAAWLDVLIRLLRVPPRERAEIRDELESHLRERVRDLMLAGHAEDHATTRAIAELGEAAQLAERFRAARNRPFLRRHAMNLSILTVAGAAAIMSSIAFSTTAGTAATPPGAGATITVAPRVASSSSGDGVLSLRFDIHSPDPLAEVTTKAMFEGVPLGDALTAIAGSAGLPAIIRWEAFEAAGVTRDQPVTLSVDKELALPTIMRLLNESMDGRSAGRIEYRVAEGILEIAPRQYFDRRETELVSYDLGAVFAKGVESGEVVGLITSLVEMDNWTDNGGDLASAKALSDRLFISAPPRMHERVVWILRQIEQPSACLSPKVPQATGVIEYTSQGRTVLPLLQEVPLLTPQGRAVR
jgi:hypothetical protein